MSNRSRSKISEEEIVELVSKLLSLLPDAHRHRQGSSRASAASLLKETCDYISSLRQEVDDLSDRLSELMATTEFNGAQAKLLQSLFRS